MPSYSRTTRLDAAADRVFEWHTRSGAFERLSPPWSPVRRVQRTGSPPAPGSRLSFEVKLGPVWRRWVAEHGDWIPGEMFSDRQLAGPFRAWDHTHRFIDAEGDGAESRLEDTVSFALPFGPVGALGLPYARHQVERMFGYRHRVTASDLRFHAGYKGAAMNVLLTGSSGLIGQALSAFLTGGGHTVRRLRRTPTDEPNETSWNPTDGTFAAGAFDGVDAVVHLAGESIAGGRWTPTRKARIRESRVNGTRRLSEALAKADPPPKVLVSASAIGFYGDRGDQLLDETSAPGSGFLADVCQEWEAAAAPALDRGIRVVHPRIGIVLSPAGGALAQMLLPFTLGVGGVIGSGDQYMSWIALDDLLGIILQALGNEALSGPVNAVSPHAVTNRDFTKTLGTVLKRPTILPMPAFAARLAFGEMADALLLASTRVDPAALRAAGHEFAYPDLEDALRHVLGR